MFRKKNLIVRFVLLFKLFKLYRTEGYPLGVVPETITIDPSPVDRELILHIVPKLRYDAVLQAVEELRPHCVENLPRLPATLPETMNDMIVNDLHLVLMDVHVTAGVLVCPCTKRQFPIKDGIPNMILHEDEI